MNIGVLTGGGDCPGLNAAIRAIARKADLNNHRVVGFHNAWEGLLHNNYAKDQFGRDRLGGISTALAPLIEEATGFDVRVVQIGHLQRGGTPTAYDRILATRFGLSAIDAAKSGAFGMMTVLNANSIQHAPLTLTEGTTRTVDLSLYGEIDDVFFG